MIAFKNWPLEVRLSPLFRDPVVLNLLLACLYAGCPAPTRPGVFQGGGFQIPGLTFPQLRTCLDAFPKIEAGTGLANLLRRGEHRANQEKFLPWLGGEFEAMFIAAPAYSQVTFPKAQQFLVLNGPITRELTFQSNLKTCGSQLLSGQAGFHGTPPSNIFAILHQGLLNRHNCVWYSSQPGYSLGFLNKNIAVGTLSGLRNSASKGKSALFGVGAVHGWMKIGDQGIINSWDQGAVAVRYVFVLPADQVSGTGNSRQIPDDRRLRRVMQSTYERLRDFIQMTNDMEIEKRKTK